MLDPRGPERGIYRVLRGGGYRNDPSSATVFNRGSARPDARSASITFRIARPLEAKAPPPTLSKAAPNPSVSPNPTVSPTPAPAPTPIAAPKPAGPPPSAPPSAPKQPSAPASPPTKAAAPQPAPGAVVTISGVSFTGDADGVTVEIAADGQARHKSMTLTSPDRLVIDLANAVLSTDRKVGVAEVNRGGVQRIRYSQFQLEPPVVRVVIDMERPLGSSVSAAPGALSIRLRP